jgi:hypothetical protein
VRLLLQNKADKHKQNHDGETASQLIDKSSLLTKESKTKMLELLDGAPSQGKQSGCVIC